MELIYNEDTGMWEEHKEPFAVVEFSTEEDYNRFVDMVEFWKEYHVEGNNDRQKDGEH